MAKERESLGEVCVCVCLHIYIYIYRYIYDPGSAVLWCGVVWLCPRCVALFPFILWGGVVWLCSRPGPYCSSGDISGIIIIIIIIIHGWYPHKPAVLRGSVPPSPVVWCGCPPCGAASTAAATSIPSGKKSPQSQGSPVFDS